MPIYPAQSQAPCVITLATWTAAAAGGSYIVDCQTAQTASVQINVTITLAGNSACKVQGSDDGINWVDIASATATATGTSASFLIRLGQLDYQYVKLVVGNPSAGTLSGNAIAFLKSTAPKN
jgi:hypothetical protein